MKTYRWISYLIWLVSLAALGVAVYPLHATSSDCWDMVMSVIVLISLAALMTYLLLTHPFDSSRQHWSERLFTDISCLIPQEHREGIVGDITEDCQELREMGRSERRTRIYAVRQVVGGAVRAWPTALVAAVRRVFSTK